MRDQLQTLEKLVADMTSELERLKGMLSKADVATPHRAAG